MNIKVSLSKNLWRTSAQAHELEIKGVCSNFIPHGMSTVIFQFPHRSMIFYPIMERKKCCKHTTSKEFAKLFGFTSHTSTSKIEFTNTPQWFSSGAIWNKSNSASHKTRKKKSSCLSFTVLMCVPLNIFPLIISDINP